MFGLLRLVIKVGCLALFVYGVSQLEVNNVKLGDHAKAYAVEFLDQHGDTIERTVSKSFKRKLAEYLRNFIAKNLDEDDNNHEISASRFFQNEKPSFVNTLRRNLTPKKSTYTEKNIIDKEINMDEAKLQKLLGD